MRRRAGSCRHRDLRPALSGRCGSWPSTFPRSPRSITGSSPRPSGWRSDLEAALPLSRCRSTATRRTGCSAPSGRTPSGCSTPRRGPPPPASRGCRMRSSTAWSRPSSDLADGSWDRRHGAPLRLRSTTQASASSSACLELPRRGRDGRAPSTSLRSAAGWQLALRDQNGLTGKLAAYPTNCAATHGGKLAACPTPNPRAGVDRPRTTTFA